MTIMYLTLRLASVFSWVLLISLHTSNSYVLRGMPVVITRDMTHRISSPVAEVLSQSISNSTVEPDSSLEIAEKFALCCKRLSAATSELPKTRKFWLRSEPRTGEFNNLLSNKVLELRKIPFDESDYICDRVLGDAVKIAYEGVSDIPSTRATNFAHAFFQYGAFIDPQAIKAFQALGLTKLEAFFYFMVGQESHASEKKEFAQLIAGETESTRPVDAKKPLTRFNTATISLEGFIWLRNFESINPPEYPEFDLFAERMRRIAFRSTFLPFSASDEVKVFEYVYDKAHGSGEQFLKTPNFAVLDYDYASTLVKALQAEADKFTEEAQGRCGAFVAEEFRQVFLEKAAYCSVQQNENDDSTLGKKIAQNFAQYATENKFPLIEGDTRSDEQKFLVFMRNELDSLTQKGKLHRYIKHVDKSFA